jgi:hypothetical protein
VLDISEDAASIRTADMHELRTRMQGQCVTYRDRYDRPIGKVYRVGSIGIGQRGDIVCELFTADLEAERLTAALEALGSAVRVANNAATIDHGRIATLRSEMDRIKDTLAGRQNIAPHRLEGVPLERVTLLPS